MINVTPHGWVIEGTSTIHKGPYAELDTKAEAQRIGGACKAYPVYIEQGARPTKQEPVEDERAILIAGFRQQALEWSGYKALADLFTRTANMLEAKTESK